LVKLDNMIVTDKDKAESESVFRELTWEIIVDQLRSQKKNIPSDKADEESKNNEE